MGPRRSQPTLVAWFVKSGAVRAMEALYAVRIARLATTKQTSKNGGSIRRGCQFIGNRGHSLTVVKRVATELPLLSSGSAIPLAITCDDSAKCPTPFTQRLEKCRSGVTKVTASRTQAPYHDNQEGNRGGITG